MRALVTRVRGQTQYHVSNRRDEFEGPGLVVLLGWMQSDATQPLDDLSASESWLLDKVLGLRIFPDSSERMNLSLLDYLQHQRTRGGVLWVSQFTLAAELESGFRPSFSKALRPDLARKRFELFCQAAQKLRRPEVSMIFGDFGEDMSLRYTNWGPLSVLLER